MKSTKNIFSIALLAAFALVGCQKDESVSPLDGLETYAGQTLDIGAAGETIKFKVQTSDSWVASTSEPWILVTPANGNGTTQCQIVIDSALMNTSREGAVTITYSSYENYSIKIDQEGYPQAIDITSDADVSIPNYAALESRYFNVEISTNVEIEVASQPSWIESVTLSSYSLDRGARPRGVTAKVVYKNNTNPERDRIDSLTFKPKDTAINLLSVVNVTQDAGDLIEDTIAGDSLAVIAIGRNINAYAWEYTEPMKNWSHIELWEVTDPELEGYINDRMNDKGFEGKTYDQMLEIVLGRVKSVSFFLFNTDEEMPYEVQYLKHCVDINFSSNSNNDYKTVPMGPNISKMIQLKRLTLFAAGMVEIDSMLTNLTRLEELSFPANRLSKLPEWLNEENFPKMKKLDFAGNIVNYTYDLSNATFDVGEAGMEISTADLKRLFLWSDLEYLSLSYNYNYGELPDFKESEYNSLRYSQDDINDTENNPTLEGVTEASLSSVPKILPNCKTLRLNLNRFTGKIPDWILYHPNLLYFDPYTLIFYQEGYTRAEEIYGGTTEGKAQMTGFSNEPANFDYYYSKFPYWKELTGN